MTRTGFQVLTGAGRTDEFATAERCGIIEHLNDPRLADVSLARARVASGVTTELHVLTVRELYVILEGRGRMEDGAGRSVPVGPGDCVDIPAGAPQRIANDGPGDLVFLCLCMPRFTPEDYTAVGP